MLGEENRTFHLYVKTRDNNCYGLKGMEAEVHGQLLCAMLLTRLRFLRSILFAHRSWVNFKRGDEEEPS